MAENEEMQRIIRSLLANDNEIIKKATTDLYGALKNPQSITILCDVVVRAPERQVRQYAAVLLTKRFGKRRHWEAIDTNQQQLIKSGMFSALIAEKEKSVRTSIAQMIGALIRHEAKKDPAWISYILQFIYEQSSSSDSHQAEFGSSIFATLTDAAPDQFVIHIDSICNLLTQALLATQASGNMSTPILTNIIAGVTSLLPLIAGRREAEKTISKCLPLILKSLQSIAYYGQSEDFSRSFEVIDGLAEVQPKTISANFRPLLDMCLNIANNKQLDDVVRVLALTFLGRLCQLKRRTIVKQKLLETIMSCFFEALCEKVEFESCDENYFGEDDGANPTIAATNGLDALCACLPPEKVISQLLSLVRPGVRDVDVFRRRGSYIALGLIAEGCSEAISIKYMDTMWNFVKQGIQDPEQIVRQASFFALGQFSEYLQPDIAKFADQVLPVFYIYIRDINIEMNKPDGKEPPHTIRFFYAFEAFCECLEDCIEEHLPQLIDELFQCFHPNATPHIYEMAFAVLSSVALAAKEKFMPYFEKTIHFMKPYLVKTIDKKNFKLRTQVLDTLSCIARSIGRVNFFPLANDTMNYCLILLNGQMDDPDLRRATYSLIGSLACVVNNEMGCLFPNLMHRLVETILSTEDIIRDNFNNTDDDIPPPPELLTEDNNLDSEDDSLSSDNSGHESDYEVANDYLDEKEEAINCIRFFAINCYESFAPYLQMAFETCYKSLDHNVYSIRNGAIDTLTQIVIALKKLNNLEGTRKACEILVPKFIKIISKDSDITVAINAIDQLCDIFKSVRELALATDDMADNVFNMINDVIEGKTASQYEIEGNNCNVDMSECDSDDEDGEYCEQFIQSAGNLLPYFGGSMHPARFASFFGRIYKFFLRTLTKAQKYDDAEKRAFCYGVIAECFQFLGPYVSPYFDVLCQIMIDGLKDEYDSVRQNSAYGLGEIVLAAREQSYNIFGVVLESLGCMLIKEEDSCIRDSVCGCIARFTITNFHIVPLNKLMPILLEKLPIRKDLRENLYILKFFNVIFANLPDIAGEYFSSILSHTFYILMHKKYDSQDTFNFGLNLLTDIQKNYNEKFGSLVNNNIEFKQFMQSM